MPNLKQFKTKEEYREWYCNYRKQNREKLREYNNDYNLMWRIKNGREKDRCRATLDRAIRKKIIKRGKCEVCGKIGAEGHHFDYSKPLKVIWLCPIHHKDMHRKIVA